MKISVLISTYNRREALQKTLQCLLAQDYPLGELELIVLDDTGSDGTYEELLRRSTELLSSGLRGFQAMRNPDNMGIAYGRCRLTEAAVQDSEAILYLDDDVYLEKNTIGGLVNCLQKDQRRALAGPRLVYASEPLKTAHCANFVGKWSGRYSEKDPSSEMECDWLNSSCLLARRAPLSGLKDNSDFYTAHEEVDFCLQLRNAGYLVVYFPEVRAAHDLPLSGSSRRDRLYYLYRNKLRVFIRNFTPIRLITALLVMVFLGLPKALIESLAYNRGVNFREIGLIFRAFADGLRDRGGKL